MRGLIWRRRQRTCSSGLSIRSRTGSEGGFRFRSAGPPRVKSTRWNLPYSPRAVNPSFRHSGIPALVARSPGCARLAFSRHKYSTDDWPRPRIPNILGGSYQVSSDFSRMSLRERVARNLRRLRHEKSMSQEELAHLAQVNRNSVGMLEREEFAASIDLLERLALALGVDATEFLRDDT